MRQEMPPWWRDVDSSIRLGITEYEFVIARLEAMLAGASDKPSKYAMLDPRRWENLLAKAKSAGERVAKSLALASARRRDANAIGLIPPSGRELAVRARAASAKFHVVGALAQGRIARIRGELRQLGRPRKRPSLSISPLQIDVHV